jgi:hypothetical protein
MATFKQPPVEFKPISRLRIANREQLAQDISDFEADWDEVQERQAVPPRWQKLAVWCAVIVFCAAAWRLIIWGVLALGDWLTGRL